MPPTPGSSPRSSSWCGGRADGAARGAHRGAAGEHRVWHLPTRIAPAPPFASTCQPKLSRTACHPCAGAGRVFGLGVERLLHEDVVYALDELPAATAAGEPGGPVGVALLCMAAAARATRCGAELWSIVVASPWNIHERCCASA